MSAPTIQDIYRVLEAFDFVASGGIYPANATDAQCERLDNDRKRIIDRYEALKWTMGFGEAMTIAKAEYMYWLFNGGVKP